MLAELATDAGAPPRPASGSGIAVLARALPISNASWFYIAVVLTWILGFCICISHEKYRRWLLGLKEPPAEPEREIPATTSLSDHPADVGAEQPALNTAALQSDHSYVWQIFCRKKRNPETEMTVPISEADSRV